MYMYIVTFIVVKLYNYHIEKKIDVWLFINAKYGFILSKSTIFYLKHEETVCLQAFIIITFVQQTPDIYKW
jgi:hypothetical protein